MSKAGTSMNSMAHNPIPLTVHLHIYKKGKILNFKHLNEGVNRGRRNYIFSGKVENSSINTIVSATNYMNLDYKKMFTRYFELSKDPSENLSKAPSVLINFPLSLKGE